MPYETRHGQTDDALRAILELLDLSGRPSAEQSKLRDGIAEAIDDAISDYADSCWDTNW